MRMSAENRAAYEEWLWTKARQQDARLFRTMLESQRHFDDMTLGRYERRLSRCVYTDGRIEYGNGLFDELWDGCSSGWIITYDSGLDTELIGQCDHEAQTIRIREGLSARDERLLILHEMIHAHECRLPEGYRQYVFYRLCKVWTRRAGARWLDAMIHADAHVVRYVHTPLFLLKSLDLDYKFNKPFGTIYGYERTDRLPVVKPARR